MSACLSDWCYTLSAASTNLWLRSVSTDIVDGLKAHIEQPQLWL